MELFVVDGPDQGRSFALGPQSVLGRDPTSSVHLTDEEVSRRHAIIMVGEGHCTIEDLGSSNGTYLDDQLVEGEAEIGAGARIAVGRTVLELRELPGADPENLKSTKVPLPPPEAS
ncbi:MAG TPA: FHA domain-containing protein [Thermoleophilaceae bacterium]|nr:FHA domain-containing protein [Thermoleophilaceae bacterium]